MLKPVRTAYSETYFAQTPQASMRKLPLVAKAASTSGFAQLVKPVPVTRQQLELIHDPTYVECILSGQGLRAKSAFGFWSKGYRDGVLAINGGNILAAKLALEDGIAANVGQGFHHAQYHSGAGYCTFNGLALVAALNPDLKVLVIDCDEHAGDGTAGFVPYLENLSNFSICGSQIGSVFKGARSIMHQVRTGDAKAYWNHLLEALVYAEKTKPDLVIYQAGMDPHEDDPYATTQMTTAFLEKRDRFVMESLAQTLHIPFFFVLAGGYQEPIEECLIPLHLKTFEIAAEVKSRIIL